MPIITEGRRSQLVPDGDDATDGFSLHFAHHDYAAADGFNSRRMEATCTNGRGGIPQRLGLVHACMDEA
jgi:hypothetical protein